MRNSLMAPFCLHSIEIFRSLCEVQHRPSLPRPQGLLRHFAATDSYPARGHRCHTTTSATTNKMIGVRLLSLVTKRPEDSSFNICNERIPVGAGLPANCGVAIISLQSLCGPSRNSFLTSRRPDTLKLYDNYSYWRDTVGNIITLPQHLKNHGYRTMSVGKSSNGSDDFPYSWSEKPFHPFTDRYKNAPVCRVTDTSPPACNIVCPVHLSGVPNSTLPDIETLKGAKSFIRSNNRNKKPFFLAVGFQKPHIPLKYPDKYLKHHPLQKFQIPDNYEWSDNVSSVAYNPWADLRKRDDIKNFWLKFPYQKIPMDYARLIIQSYYAAVTYIDDLIGQLIKQLTISDVQCNTTVILMSDHGWSLGEHGEWAKYSNFDVALRVPVIMSIPGLTNNCRKSGARISGKITDLLTQNNSEVARNYIAIDSMIELVDIFPTIADIIGLSIPVCMENKNFGYNHSSVPSSSNPCTEGLGFLPLIVEAMSGKSIPWKKGVFSQYPRPGIVPTLVPNSDEPRLYEISIMGYTIKTKEYRYTTWLAFNHSTAKADWTTMVAEELYHNKLDVEENINLVTTQKFSMIKEELRIQLKNGWRQALPRQYR
ncbi:iduronate 2-sulfatase isoform X2 [Athalia rosae]|uniref:iduronate 2-sulfatase isoform X2 n=1 Tax=Athalia rosae TaxID=37344 RepID=UPI00203329C8|nr:iduronate 2-sulfatase isoform X2 [Athalia rosae]